MKSMRVLMCVVVFVSAATATVGAPLQAAETSTSSTIVAPPPGSSKPFTWSEHALTVGTTVKASKLVSSTIKGTPTYRASGVCSLRKGVLSFNRVGKCRVSVSVKMKNTGKVLRSSKVFMVQAKTAETSPVTAGMPDPIGCVKASSHPVSGTPYPDSSPGFYEFQTGWTCNWDTLDARPLLEYFKFQGWVQKSSESGMVAATLYKGSNRVTYGPQFDRMPAGQAFLILTIY
jgi:hypothetical protein